MSKKKKKMEDGPNFCDLLEYYRNYTIRAFIMLIFKYILINKQNDWFYLYENVDIELINIKYCPK